jgi:cystathionine beta-lyase/cystathionine gamma-synthase
MYGHSGIMSFYHKGGLEESKKLLQELKLITLAESLGGYESLAELPYLVKTLMFGQNSCGRLFFKYF